MSKSESIRESRGHYKMKIDELNQNPVASNIGNPRTDKTEAADAHGESAARQQKAADKVELSSYMPVVPASQVRLGARADRVEEIKSQIESGSYEVSSRDIAEKMLSRDREKLL